VARGAAGGRATGLRLWSEALTAAIGAQGLREWRGSPLHLAGLARPLAKSFAASPRDARPTDALAGEAILGGVISLAGETLILDEDGGDPWTTPSPSRRFAEALHRFDWLGDLMAAENGEAEALRLVLIWQRVFGRWNRFAWDPAILERRVFNLACRGQPMTAEASEGQTGLLAQGLARQARFLLKTTHTSPRAAERLTAVLAAGLALGGKAGERLAARSLRKLDAALDRAVAADGGHASRAPEAAMELLLDLRAVEDGFAQRCLPVPTSLLHAIDRLTRAVRFFALCDGRLPALQGGEEAARARVQAALADDGADLELKAPSEPYCGGYHRMDAPGLQVVVDAAPPARGRLSTTACGQPLAIEVLAGSDRLITSSAWSPRAAAPQALRVAAGASTATLGTGYVGAGLRGFPARALGARLIGGVRAVEAHRRETEAGVWLDMSHAGWLARTGLTHERRLFVDKGASELRGEDRFVPKSGARAVTIPVAIYFHVHPETTASLARDQKSVLLKGPSEVGWWLRNDAGEVAIEGGVHVAGGRPRRSQVVVLRGRLRADRGGRIRWKLAMAEAALTLLRGPTTPDPVPRDWRF
jgi:uncharacterized heparinase superfamily protein